MTCTFEYIRYAYSCLKLQADSRMLELVKMYSFYFILFKKSPQPSANSEYIISSVISDFGNQQSVLSDSIVYYLWCVRGITIYFITEPLYLTLFIVCQISPHSRFNFDDTESFCMM